MRRPVRIVRQPKAQSGFEIKMNPGMGFNANQLSWPVMAGEFSAPEVEVNNTIGPTDWDFANLEAERGETVVTNLNHDGIPEHYTIGGKRHYEGGTPLNLPPNSFIFSRDRSMKIKDEEILKMFNMSANKKGYTPADIAKQYDINKFRRILADPDSEDLQRETAEMMIANYNLKLGKLALVQESLKGFPQGIPMISNPYLQSMNMNPEEFAQTQAQPDQSGEEDVARYGKQVRRNLPKHQTPPGNTTGMVDADGNGISDFIQAPGLNTTGSGSGSLVIKSKGTGLGGLFENPNKAMDTFIAGEQFVTNLANLDEKQAAEKKFEDQFKVTNLMGSVGENKGDYLKDQYAGLHFRPDQTGQQMLSPSAASQQPGMNISKYGGQGSLPRADKGLWIKQILDFESKKGSASGTGLQNYGIKKDVWASKYPKMWEDNKITEDEAIDFIEKEYMPMVKDYPEEAQKRLVDYAYNTGRDIRDVIMLASGVQSLDNVQTKNTDDALWNTNKDAIMKSMSDPQFINKLDDAKKKIYEDTWKRKGDSDAYTKTSLPRVNMWNQSDNTANPASNATSTNTAAGTSQTNNSSTFQNPAANTGNPNQGTGPRMKMFGNVESLGNGFFGPRSRMVGMRYNQDKGIYEAVNRRGEVIGFFNAGQGQGASGNTGSSIYGTSGNTGEEITTTTKKKVKKQVIPDGSEVIKRSDYKTDAEYEAARDKAFADAGGKKTVYTQDKDGKYYTVGESPMFDGNKDIDAQLGYLKEQFSDPKMAKALREKMIAASNDGTKLKKNKAEIQQMLNDPNMTDQQFVDQFLELNTRNRKVNDLIQGSYKCYDNSTGKWKGGSGCDDKIGKKYASLDAAAQAAGVPMGDAKNKTLQQLSYIGYDDLLNDAEAGKIKDADVASKLKNFKRDQFGVNDEAFGSGKNKGKVSAADSYYTNTTAGQVAGIIGKKRKEDLLAETEVEEDVITKKKQAAEYARQTGRSPWFIQDIMKSGNAFRQWAGIQKDMPWMPMPDVTLPEGVYYDPNRQLAANSEIAANTLQNLGAFQGPQGLSSRASQIFGQTARGAADTLSQFNNQNVGVANNMELQRANILNQNAIRRTGLAKQLYDENTIANQQYRNSKNQAMENMVNQWVSGKTNAVNAYNLNQMFPQYHTHPEAGGIISFEGGRPVTPDISGKDSFLNKYKEYRGILPAGTDDNVIWNLVKSDLGTANNSEVDPDYLKAMAATMQGMSNPIKGYNNS